MLVAGALLAVPSFAQAAEARRGKIDLTWNAPIGCPDREQVLDAIVELMGDAQGSDVAVRVDVARVGAHLVLKLVLKTAAASSERTMESNNCDELARGAALVVALAAGAEPPKAVESEAPSSDASRTSASSAPEVVAPTPATASDAARTTTATPSAGTPDVAAERGHLVWGALFGVDAGSFPQPTVGGALAARYDVAHFSAGFETLVLLPQDISTSVGGGRFWGAALALRPCLRWRFSRLRLHPCAVADLEMMVAEGRGVTFREQSVASFFRFGAGAELGYALTRRVSALTAAWVLAAPARPTFVVDGTIPIHSPGIFSARWEAGLEFRL